MNYKPKKQLIKHVLPLCFVLLLFLCTAVVHAQEKSSFEQDYEFTLYLLGNQLYDDAELLLSRDRSQESEYPTFRDSLFYLKGLTYYNRKELEKSIFFFDSVSSSSLFRSPSLFFSAFGHAYLGNYGNAKQQLSKLSDTLGIYKELSALQMAGIALLERDLKAFDSCRQHFYYQDYRLSEQEKTLESIRHNIENVKKKSPWVAGISSAIIPGLGKIYTGHLGEGIASFLTVGSLAAITAENWVKAGFTNWKTLVFGSLGTIFYIGNIYGSVASVKIYYDEFNQNQNITILYSIHIPLRSFFN